MRNGQKRMRGRSGGGSSNNHRKSQNPLTRVYESNGPDVKIRGTASHIAEKYIQLARDSQGSGDPVAAENYYQHAEHYFRLIAAAQEQFRQQNPYYNNPAPQQGAPQGAADDNFDDGDDDSQPFLGQNEPSYTPQPPAPQAQPYLPRDAQPFPPRDQPQNSRPQHQPRPQQSYAQPSGQGGNDSVLEATGLPAFITGGGQPQQNTGQNANQGGQNGHEQGDRGQDRYGRRRRRHRGGSGFRPDRPDFGNANPQGAVPSAPAEGGDEPPRQPD